MDEQYYKRLKQLQDMVAKNTDNDDQLAYLELFFDTTQDWMGTKKNVELIKGGSEIQLTSSNFSDYIDASLQYKLLEYKYWDSFTMVVSPYSFQIHRRPEKEENPQSFHFGLGHRRQHHPSSIGMFGGGYCIGSAERRDL